MYRSLVFLMGLITAGAALPAVLSHHARAELLQLAWCSSSGSSAPDIGFLVVHCAACPILVAAIAAMMASPLFPVRRQLARSKAAHR